MSPADEALDALARELPIRQPDPGRLEQLRTEILVAAGTITPQRARLFAPRAMVLAAVAVLAIAAALVLMWRVMEPPVDGAARSRASIVAAADAELAHISPPPDEVVQLRHGLITVEVAALGAQERFRVITGDAEVEVRGTRFVVASDRGRIRSVEVIAGVVELRLRAGGSETLAAGQRWDAPDDLKTAVAPVAPPSNVPSEPVVMPASPASTMRGASAPRKRAQTPSTRTSTGAKDAAPAETPAAAPSAPAPSAPGESEFRAGWDALKQGAPARAADAFAASKRIAGRGAIAEDATYWEGVALARAGRAAPAIRALRAFLSAYPRSARAGEAAARLGWLLVDAGDFTGAERWFRAAADDAVPAVRNSARAGLERVTAAAE